MGQNRSYDPRSLWIVAAVRRWKMQEIAMSQHIALILWLAIITWLFARDRKLRPMTSGALWLPLLWVMLIGSRTVSYWLDFDVDRELLYDASVEGSPLDRNVFLILIIGAAFTLWRRRLDWGRIFASNSWLFVFFLYCGLSITWSDYPFASFKKWIKDLGNIMMILVIITEANPVLAIRAVFSRYIYFSITLSALLIIFFPDLGTLYIKETGMLAYCGITLNKNQFGHILAICGLFMAWDFVAGQMAEKTKTDKLVRSVLAAILIWMFVLADSVTPLLCMVLGIAIILVMLLPSGERLARHLGVYSLIIGIVIIALTSFPEITDLFFRLVRRETTFTGRTDIWTGLLRESVNPIIGTGFQGFWLQSGMMERYDNINEAHNGYLETYLNGGLIGLSLLVAMLISVGSKIKDKLLRESSYSPLLFSFLVVTVIYNLTESVFNRLDLTWFVFLIAALGSAQPLSDENEQEKEGSVFLNADGGRKHAWKQAPTSPTSRY